MSRPTTPQNVVGGSPSRLLGLGGTRFGLLSTLLDPSYGRFSLWLRSSSLPLRTRR